MLFTLSASICKLINPLNISESSIVRPIKMIMYIFFYKLVRMNEIVEGILAFFGVSGSSLSF